ncbi:MAG: sulfurtransferase complex subunit TusB [Candidatus Nitrospinota bacterium M3_3B_026]
MLHTVNKSPFTNDTLDECVRFAAEGSPILLLEDGVYAALAGSSFEARMREILKNHEVYAIRADVKARGLERLIDGVKVIGYDGFVDLVEKSKTHAWV